MKRIYELSFHIVPTLSKEEAESTFDDMQKVVKDEGGEALESNFFDKIDLSYKMRDVSQTPYMYYDEAYFCSIKFSIENDDGMNNIKERVLKDKKIFRSLLISTFSEDTRMDKDLIEEIAKLRDAQKRMRVASGDRSNHRRKEAEKEVKDKEEKNKDTDKNQNMSVLVSKDK